MMKRIAVALLSFFAVMAHATVWNVNSGQSQTTIQGVINGAIAGDSVAFAAGTYTLTTGFTGQCGVAYYGPTATPATVVFAIPAGYSVLSFYNCSTGNTSVKYISSQGPGGGIEISGNSSNFDIEQNQIYGLTAQYGCQFPQTGTPGQPGYYPGSACPGSAVNPPLSDCAIPAVGTPGHSGYVPAAQCYGIIGSWYAAIHIDGTINQTANNITIKYNTFGDPNSCSATYPAVYDLGGNCAGIFVVTGYLLNATFEYNYLNHVEEGIHVNNILSAAAGSGTPAGTPQSVTSALQIKYNYFLNWHRIGIEIQTGLITTGQQVAHNAMVNPINPSWGTMFISTACCTGGRTFLTSAPPNPANSTYDNVFVADSSHVQTVGGFHAPVIGIEYWTGSGGIAAWNYEGGNWSNGINWGYASTPYYIYNNYLCGMYGGSYITDEENSNAPTLGSGSTANTTTATCSTLPTQAPTITQSSTQVTLTDVVNLANVPDGQPISIYYTTDGSTPTTNSTLYTGPFSPATNSVVKAIGMWGVAPEPSSYPSGYGYVPSTVVSATFTGAGGSPTLVSLALSGTSSLTVGGATSQLTATGTYSSGPTAVVAPTSWASDTTTVCTVSSVGVVTPVAAGSCNITATLSGVTSPNFPVTVTSTTVTGNFLGTTPIANVNQLIVGQTEQMQYIVAYSNGTSQITPATSYAVQSSSPSTGVCSVTSPGGLVTALGAGTCTIQANGYSSGWGFTVSSATLTSLALSSMTGTIVQNATAQVTATGTYSNSTTAPISPTSWTSSNAAIASVNAMGLVTGVAPGTATITATYGSVTSPGLLFTVTQAAPPSVTLTSVTLSPAFSYTNHSFTMSLLGTYSDSSQSPITGATFSSSNPAVATIDQTGLITTTGVGSTTISALYQTQGNAGGNNFSASSYLVVPPPNASSGPTLWPSFCPAFQSLTPGTYTVVIAPNGTVTITP